MNSLVVMIFGVTCLGAGYFFYGRIIEKVWAVDPDRKTPAHEFTDGVDYVPARHWTVLFGHHFASIAGAGPIIGPVIAAAMWGWLPALLWIIIGSIFVGAVHDFSALILSLRHQGRSIGDVAESVIGYRTKMLLCSFLWLTLVLVIAVFAAVAGNTLASKPQVVIPTFGLIPVAYLVGLMLYRWKLNQIAATLIGVSCLFALIYWGYHVPVDIKQLGQLSQSVLINTAGQNVGAWIIVRLVYCYNILGQAAGVWTIVLLIYAYIASVMPVNILLQPRDYIATFVLYFGLLFGFLGLLITRPLMNAPAFISYQAKGGPLWPMMFVIVACGAVSGFHSLIAAGTTSKQLALKKDARKIGYGAMILEGVLALLAMICVTAGLYWVKTEGVGDNLVYPLLMKKNNWILAFGEGYGQITKPLFGVFGTLIAITTLKTFVMTTLDSATRIGRYVTEELLDGLVRQKDTERKPANRYLATVFIIVPAMFLALGAWKNIWPVFGAANQLVAALALLVATVWLKRKGKKYWYTAVPTILMFITTIAALLYKIKEFWPARKMLALVGVILLGLAFLVIKDAIAAMRRTIELKK